MTPPPGPLPPSSSVYSTVYAVEVSCTQSMYAVDVHYSTVQHNATQQLFIVYEKLDKLMTMKKLDSYNKVIDVLIQRPFSSRLVVGTLDVGSLMEVVW